MVPSLRQQCNQPDRLAAVDRVQSRIVEQTGEPIPFPLSNVPVFVPRELAEQLSRAVSALFEIIRRPDYGLESHEWIPPAYRGSVTDQEIPPVSCFDFAVCRGRHGELRPYLLECHGCSSLLGIVPWYGQLLNEDLDLGCDVFLDYACLEEYRSHLRSVLEGSLLIDVATAEQKLRTDFWMLREMAGLEVVDLSEELIERLDRDDPLIYPRVVPVEAEETGLGPLLEALCSSPRRWIGSPAWYFQVGKRSLPLFLDANHPDLEDVIPRSADLTPETARAWTGEVDFVLKPAYNFGGKGVNLHPTASDVETALSSGEDHVLQERVELAAAVEPPTGPPLFCDLRVMCLEDRPVSFFCRLARDPLCNISFNDRYEWCGITAGLIPKET